MIIEALKFLADQAKAAAEPKPLDLNDPTVVAYLVDGEVKTYDVAHPPRKHEAASLKAFTDLAVRFGAGVVWYDEEQAVLVIDDEGHRVETVTLPLKTTAVFDTISGLDKTWREQKDFIRLLRIDLAGTLEPVHLLERVRKVKFENGVTVSGAVTRTGESMGREIASRVEADGEIPETVVLKARLYDVPDFAPVVLITCSVEVDASRGLFRLMPLPDEISKAYQFCLNQLAGEIAERIPENMPAYQGKP